MQRNKSLEELKQEWLAEESIAHIHGWDFSHINDRYEEEDRGIRIIELENAFQLCTKKEMYEYLIRVAKQPKKPVLTDVVMETPPVSAWLRYFMNMRTWANTLVAKK